MCLFTQILIFRIFYVLEAAAPSNVPFHTNSVSACDSLLRCNFVSNTTVTVGHARLDHLSDAVLKVLGSKVSSLSLSNFQLLMRQFALWLNFIDYPSFHMTIMLTLHLT